MKEYTYILEKYTGKSSRHTCPSCRKNTFVRYIHKEDKTCLRSDVGRCNREIKCGYHYTPKDYYRDNNMEEQTYSKTPFKPSVAVKKPEKKKTSFIETDALKNSLNNYENNNFVRYLHNQFGNQITQQLIKKYLIATSDHWQGATIFWQIDKEGKIRTGKIMLYNPHTGKRIKQPFNHISWMHKHIQKDNFELNQCLFGEHLLKTENKPVAIVESEKTAIISSVYLPQFTWLATGSISNLTLEKCRILKDKKVILFPDLNGYEKWKEKSAELSSITNFVISDLLQQKATEEEKHKGLDLADYLIQYNYTDFQNTNTPDKLTQYQEQQLEEEKQAIYNFFKLIQGKKKKANTWEQEINQLETFFANFDFPLYPLKINQWETITDIRKYIAYHLSVVKANNGKTTFQPYLNRLKQLKNYLLN